MSDKEERGFLGSFFKSQPEPVKPKRSKGSKPDTSVIDGLKAEIAELREMINKTGDSDDTEPKTVKRDREWVKYEDEEK